MSMGPAKRLEYKPDPNKFDLRTHIWDTQGKLTGKNLYRTFIQGGREYFERPVNSGNLWYANNQPAGRVELEFNEKGHITSKTFDFDAPHKQFTAPLSDAEKLHYELAQTRAKNEQLAAELEQIKQEREALQAANKSAKAPDSTVLAEVVTPEVSPPTINRRKG